MAVSISAMKMSLTHWATGWGVGTFKAVFSSLGGLKSQPWMMAHNCWVQMIFELGYFLSISVIIYYIYLVTSIFKLFRRAILRRESQICLIGLLMIGTNMMFHFPTRMIQTVLIIIFFLAYCQGVIYDGRRQSKDSEYSTS